MTSPPIGAPWTLPDRAEAPSRLVNKALGAICYRGGHDGLQAASGSTLEPADAKIAVSGRWEPFSLRPSNQQREIACHYGAVVYRDMAPGHLRDGHYALAPVQAVSVRASRFIASSVWGVRFAEEYGDHLVAPGELGLDFAVDHQLHAHRSLGSSIIQICRG
jgi:hypothetical protein